MLTELQIQLRRISKILCSIANLQHHKLLKLKLQTIIEGLNSKNMYTNFDKNRDDYGKASITRAFTGNNFSS